MLQQSLVSVQLMVVAALLTVAGLHFITAGRTRNAWRHRWFGAVAVAAAAGSFGALWRHAASTPDAFINAVRLALTLQCAFFIALAWFVALHRKGANLRIPALLAGWGGLVCCLQIAAVVILPVNVKWLNALLVAMDLCILAATAYALAVALRMRKEGQEALGIWLAIGMAPLVLVAFPYAALASWGTVPQLDLQGLATLWLIGVVSVFLIGEEVRAAGDVRQLAVREKRWHTMLDNVNLPAAECNAEGRLTYLNPHLINALGHPEAEVKGTEFEKFVVKESLEAFHSWSPEKGAAELEIEMAGLAKPFRVAWNVVAVEDQEDRFAGTVWFGTDVTELRNAQGERDAGIDEIARLKARMDTASIHLDEAEAKPLTSHSIIGQSGAIQYVLQKLQQVARTNATVLIEGETGVGKELVARALHDASNRARGPFVCVNCAALQPTLLESELFGHEKGAFTGADRLRKGRFEVAEGGTIFLDEVGELPLDMQAKLLRVLQEGEYERVGDSRTRRMDVRVIAATNRDLRQDIASGRFRSDLFFRLQVYPISVPPLRDRKEDIPLFVAEFVRSLSAKHGKEIQEVPGHVLQDLRERAWPGNVRELMNVIEQAVIATNGRVLSLPPVRNTPALVQSNAQLAGPLLPMAEAERLYILRVLEHTRGKIAGKGGAAEVLEMHPNTLRARMQKLGIHKRSGERTEAYEERRLVAAS